MMTAPQSVLRRFTTSYHPRSGELLVYGSFAAGAFLLLMTFASGNLLTLCGVFACFLCTFYFSPFLETSAAQLGADTRGLYVRSLGYIPWSAVEAFRVHRVAVRSVETARLQLRLQDGWKDSVRCNGSTPAIQRFMFRIWKKRQDNMLEVRLEHLKDDSRVIENSITEIWQNRPVSADKL